MDSITLKLPVTVKAKLTEKLKKSLLDEMEKSVKQANLEIQQINIEENRAAGQCPQNDIAQLNAIRNHFGAERAKRQDFVANTTKQMEDTQKLAIGAEIVQAHGERIAELKVGDDLPEAFNVEILIEDGKIIAIRG